MKEFSIHAIHSTDSLIRICTVCTSDEPHRQKSKTVTGDIVHLSHLIVFVGILAQPKIRLGKLLRTFKILNLIQDMSMFFPKHLSNIQAGSPLLTGAYGIRGLVKIHESKHDMTATNPAMTKDKAKMLNPTTCEHSTEDGSKVSSPLVL